MKSKYRKIKLVQVHCKPNTISIHIGSEKTFMAKMKSVNHYDPKYKEIAFLKRFSKAMINDEIMKHRREFK